MDDSYFKADLIEQFCLADINYHIYTPSVTRQNAGS